MEDTCWTKQKNKLAVPWKMIHYMWLYDVMTISYPCSLCLDPLIFKEINLDRNVPLWKAIHPSLLSMQYIVELFIIFGKHRSMINGLMEPCTYTFNNQFRQSQKECFWRFDTRILNDSSFKSQMRNGILNYIKENNKGEITRKWWATQLNDL